MRTIATLEVKNVSKGNTYYQPLMATCRGTSQYSDEQYNFDDLEGYWAIGSQRPPAKGGVYILELKTKPKSGPNSKEGAMYCDIVAIRTATADEQAQGGGAPTESQPALMDDDPGWTPDSEPPFDNGGAFQAGQDFAEKVLATPQQAPVSPNAGFVSEDAKWDAIRGEKNHQIRRGQAFNAAIEKIDKVFFGSAMDGTDVVRELGRLMGLFMEVLDSPTGWCFNHRMGRIKSKSGIFVHKQDDGWCSADGMLGADGQPVGGD